MELKTKIEIGGKLGFFKFTIRLINEEFDEHINGMNKRNYLIDEWHEQIAYKSIFPWYENEKTIGYEIKRIHKNSIVIHVNSWIMGKWINRWVTNENEWIKLPQNRRWHFSISDILRKIPFIWSIVPCSPSPAQTHCTIWPSDKMRL